MQLTPEQIKHFDSVMWLLFGPRCSGRTYLIAIVTIYEALKREGQKVYVNDHYSGEVSKKHLIDMINDIVEKRGTF